MPWKKLICLTMVTALTLAVCACQGSMNDIFNQVAKEMQSSQGLSQSEIVAGLKQALEVGTGNAVNLTGKLNGYYSNPQIKIPLPESYREVENLLRLAGLERYVTDFERSMNRAAEKAAPEAKALFFQAIKQMSFDDAKRILYGKENEATLYFKEKTYAPLTQRFEPLVHEAMNDVGVTRYYQTIENKVRNLPVGNALKFDLDQYVTTRALDGLFLVLAQEEAKIREDPAARVTELLRRVFGATQ